MEDANPELVQHAGDGKAAKDDAAETTSPKIPVPFMYQAILGLSIAGNVLLTNYGTEYLSFPIQVCGVVHA